MGQPTPYKRTYETGVLSVALTPSKKVETAFILSHNCRNYANYEASLASYLAAAPAQNTIWAQLCD